MKFYRKKLLTPMRPYRPGEYLDNIKILNQEKPKVGGMIAHDPKNPKDKWYISPEFFKEYYEEAK